MGIRVDVRGAKQFSVLLLIDGVPVTEPYFGIYDVSSIPVTDIVEIRVQLAPASPLEGPGGDGGIIEVMTLRALRLAPGQRARRRQLDARRRSGAHRPHADRRQRPRRHPRLGRRAAVESDLPGRSPATAATQASAIFRRTTTARCASSTSSDGGHFTGDVFYGHRSFYIPPSDTTGDLLQHITREDSVRLVVGGELVRHELAHRPRRLRRAARAQHRRVPRLHAADARAASGALVGALRRRRARRSPLARARPRGDGVGAPLRRQRCRQRAPDRVRAGRGAVAVGRLAGHALRRARRRWQAALALAVDRSGHRRARAVRAARERRGPTPRWSSAFTCIACSRST